MKMGVPIRRISELFVLLAVTLTCCRHQEETASPLRMTITEAVYASGTLIPGEEYRVLANTDGVIQAQYVEENDLVKAGQVLFSLSSGPRRVQEDLLAKSYEVVKRKNDNQSPQLEELDRKIALAMERYKADSLHEARLRRLLDQSAVSQYEWEQAELKKIAGKTEWKSLMDARKNWLYLADLEVKQAENQWKTLQSQNREGEIRSVINGRIYRIFREKGERVNPGESLALIGSADVWKLSLTIDERDYGLVRTGQKVLVRMDAFPGRTFEARLETIFPYLNRAEQSFTAEAVFNEPFEGGIYGLNLEANIIVREKENALCIPVSALAEGDSIWVESPSGSEKKPVKTGIRSLDWVEITEGLSESDLYIITKKRKG